MMPKIVLTLLAILFMGLAVLPVQANPFLKKNQPAEETPAVRQEAPEQKYPSFVQQLFTALNNFQRDLNSRISGLIRKIAEEHDLLALGSLLLLAFVYGVIHALGPGHGKVVMTSYAISHPLKARQGVALGVFISVIHTLSAIALVVSLYFLLKVSFTNHAVEPKRVITLLSYILLILLGGFLLVKGILSYRKKKAACGCSEAVEPLQAARWSQLLVPALVIGLVPCEGTILLLVFAISVQALWIGVLLSVAMSLGMALTISLIGLAVIGSRTGSLKLMSGSKGTHRLVSFIFETAGAACIVLIGLLFLFSTLNS